MMKKQVTIVILVFIFAFISCQTVTAVNSINVTVGKDTLITTTNYNYTEVNRDQGYPELPVPVNKVVSASNSNNKATVSLTANENEGGYAGAIVAASSFYWNASNWEEEKNTPINVTINFSYHLESYWDQTNLHGLSGAWIEILPFLCVNGGGDISKGANCYDAIGYSEGQTGSITNTKSLSFNTLDGSPLTIEKLQFVGVKAACFANTLENATSLSSSAASATINSIKIQFIDNLAPKTNLTINPVNRQNIQVTLTPTDTLSGVNYTEYRLKPLSGVYSNWIKGRSFTFSVNETSGFDYRSADKTGNIEIINSFNVEQTEYEIKKYNKGYFYLKEPLGDGFIIREYSISDYITVYKLGKYEIIDKINIISDFEDHAFIDDSFYPNFFISNLKIHKLSGSHLKRLFSSYNNENLIRSKGPNSQGWNSLTSNIHEAEFKDLWIVDDNGIEPDEYVIRFTSVSNDGTHYLNVYSIPIPGVGVIFRPVSYCEQGFSFKPFSLFGSSNTRKISQGQTVTSNAKVDSSVSQAIFEASWEGSDLNLILTSPSGAVINPQVAETNPNIDYVTSSTWEYYIIRNPESGLWTLKTTAIDVPVAEDFSTIVLLNSDINLTVTTDKESYYPGENVTIEANLTKNGNPIFDASVIAQITKPNASKENITLYDNGLNKDTKADDGIYTGNYINTSLTGDYKILILANGKINTEEFQRNTFKSIKIGIPDSTKPTVTALNPSRDSVNVPADKNITVTFSEPVSLRNNSIELKSSNGTIIPITTSINNNVLIIKHSALLNKTTKYTITLYAGSITDVAGNPITLYSRSFTIDAIRPTVTGLSPARDSTNVPADKNITVTFSEPIKAGTMNIALKSSNGTIIPITTSISGKALTINHTTLLNKATKYTITLNAGSVTDLAGNTVALYSRNFTTDATKPTVTALSPARDSINVLVNKNITVTFSEPIKAGNMLIELYNAVGNKVLVPITTSISGNVLTIKHSSLFAKATKYTITLYAGSVTDLAGNPIALYSRSFTTTKT